MAFTVKGKSYSLANIRKSVAAFAVTLGTLLGSFALVFAEFIPVAATPAIAVAGAFVAAVVVFLTKNAAVIDGLDGVDPEDTPAS